VEKPLQRLTAEKNTAMPGQIEAVGRSNLLKVRDLQTCFYTKEGILKTVEDSYFDLGTTHTPCEPSRDHVGASSARVLPHEPALCLHILKGN
jgi:hypothetical protein